MGKLKVILILFLLTLLNQKQLQANQLNSYQQELDMVMTEINLTTDRAVLIELVKQENELAKYIRAYQALHDLNNVKVENYSKNSENIDVVLIGEQWINNSEYAFGGGRNETEINRGLFDCSSFVHWAFDQVGVKLGDRTSVTTDTLKTKGDAVSSEHVQPGDLVFFDTYKIDGHVGIYAGEGQFIGAQGSTGVSYEDMKTGYWAERFNGRVRRIQ
ncbi:NlpC/P60 family protein [Amphibacillus jilinensis]|uniref:NlpC/P60 family protein n=1 Tax=Amphibacillus jilinensis TaxID=1216008 RepID=UPI00031E21E1